MSQFSAEKNHRLYTPQINHISLRMPPSPPLSQHGDLPFGTLCNESTVVNCQQEFCDCTYTLQIPLGSLVELILIDKGKCHQLLFIVVLGIILIRRCAGVTFDATHPFHIHGSAFHVVAMERVASNVTVDQIKLMDQKGHIRRNLVDAPVKDTVAVPDGGYTIVRFMATNPGNCFGIALWAKVTMFTCFLYCLLCVCVFIFFLFFPLKATGCFTVTFHSTLRSEWDSFSKLENIMIFRKFQRIFPNAVAGFRLLMKRNSNLSLFTICLITSLIKMRNLEMEPLFDLPPLVT